MSGRIVSRWVDAETAGLNEPQLLIYRSQRLGSDLRITNYGGGNTSAKVAMVDPLTGANVEVLWVKGSGGDIASAGLDGYATLHLDKVLGLEQRYRGKEHEDEIPALYPHCTFNLNPRAASIDTPLHAFVPFRHVDHMHPDAVIAIATAKDGEAVTREVWGGRVGWIGWQRPGFDLGLKIRAALQANPKLEGCVLQNHGLMHWGDTSKGCYERALELINVAIAYVESKPRHLFGGPKVGARTKEERRAFVAALAPELRGKLSREQRKVGHLDDTREVLDFVSSREAGRLAAIGTSCPDHFLRTKIWPLLVPMDAATTPTELAARLDPLIEAYVARYRAYWEACRKPDSPALRDPFPIVLMLPGIGMVSYSKDKSFARQASEFWVNAIHVMDGAERLGGYRGLPDAEAFGIEYWLLEEAKLKRLPAERPLSRRIALITGGAGGIGKASARRLLQDGAVAVLADLDAAALATAEAELAKEFGRDAVRGVVVDVCDEASVIAAVEYALVEYGGLDIVVLCAGLASAAPIEETTLELWKRNLDVLATGYFLFAREAFRVLKRQGLGGSIVVVASKNALAASPNAAAYCTAKAAELHLARCLALEGAPIGIRVNSVNPDAVLRGSKIWQGDWRKERAAAYGVGEQDLEELYRKRSLLQKNVFPEDVAEAIAWFAGDKSSKSTGNILNVDAGNKEAFPR
ncbi:MAG: bifunctional rhamnulose-1-phosphate aldolase/short-chain dehydrogenase [Planctomycetes bacterium]|nr:bifunctional rhamnulose-1-phosphate aldolase/short-chain dehydrogenase [Planctomycetota bacterium]